MEESYRSQDHEPSITAVTSGQRLPAPRLQLRWEGGEEMGGGVNVFGEKWIDREWRCHYELVLPLSKHDIRHEVWEDGEEVGRREELVVRMDKGFTRRGSTRAPCDTEAGVRFADAPYRDGAHADWDAKALGGLPVYVIAPDGTALPVEARPSSAEQVDRDSSRDTQNPSDLLIEHKRPV